MKKVNLSYTAIHILYICITLLFFTPSEKIYAQCSTSTETSTATYTDATVSTLPGSPTEWDNVVYTISGTFTVDVDFTINESDLIMGSVATISVIDGAALTVISCEIYASSSLWNAIEVEGGSSLIMQGSIVKDAISGIHALNGTSESELNITANCFINNEIGIDMDAYSGESVSLIYNNDFTAPTLISPKSGQPGDYGIRITSVENDGEISLKIGTASVYSAATANNFYDIPIGIRAKQSELLVQNNSFDNMIASTYLPGGDPPMIGVYATGTSTAYTLLDVGTVGSTSLMNVFTNCDRGIYAKNYVTLNAIFNTFDGVKVSGVYNMSRAIFVENAVGQGQVVDNTITDFSNFGIIFDGFHTGSSYRIAYNDISYSGSIASGETPFGIYVEDATLGGTLVNIESNTIADMKTGIFCRNIEEAFITVNEVDFVYPGTTGNAIGIDIEDCSAPDVSDNRCTGTCTASGSCTNKTVPFFFEHCTDAVITANFAQDGERYGMVFTGNVQGTNLTCNEIEDATRGIGLLDIGSASPPPIGLVTSGIGYIELPGTDESADNSWVGGTYRIYTDAIGGAADCDNVTWRYQNSPSEFNLTTTYVPTITGATPPDIDNAPTISDCYSIYRLSGEEATEDETDELIAPYLDWAKYYLSPTDDIDAANSYYRAWMFWELMQDNPTALAELHDDIALVYDAITASNIPVLDNISAAIHAGNYAEAAELNESIFPINVIEENMLAVISVYLHAVDEEGTLILDDAGEALLRSIAVLPGRQNGFGVYMARAILDTVIYMPDEQEEKISGLNDYSSVYVHPNPVSRYCNITGNISSDELFDITVTNILGHVVYFQRDVSMLIPIDISILPQGVYTLSGSQLNMKRFTDVIVLIKE